MKKFFSFALAILVSFNLFAQNTSGTWDAKTYTYSNAAYKITWTLPSEISWVRASASIPNIIFKAVDPETQTTLILNVKNFNSATDIWALYPSLSTKEYKDYMINNSRAAGITINSYDVVKSQLDGIHAIKTTTSMRKYDQSVGGDIDLISVSYSFILDDKLYNADFQALKILKDETENFDQVVNYIFKGIKITK